MTKNGHLFSKILLLGAVWLLPHGAFASISISEVAWMGSQSSANHEWIELHNTGQALVVDEWTLSDGMNLEIELSGTVPANSYVVLERTSDASAPGSAFLIYTGALVNTGATLRLTDANDALMDQVSGGEDWKNIGGDNVTKETAHYSPAGWITAAPTPGSAPPEGMSEPEPQETEEKTKRQTNTTSAKQSDTIQLELPDVTLELEIETVTTGYVNQPIHLTVEPSGVGDSIIESLEYRWNFGDGNSKVGKEVKHVFMYPGTYVVTVEGKYKRQRQVARHEITILPVRLSLTTNPAGDIQVNNDSPYEIDISGYTVQAHKDFVFPPYSILLPNQTITIPNAKILNSSPAMVAVYDTEDSLVASRLPQMLRTEQTREASVESFAYLPQPRISAVADTDTRVSVVEEDSFLFASQKSPLNQQDESGQLKIPEAENQVATAQAGNQNVSERWSFVALASLLLLGVLGVYLTPRRNENG